MHAWRILSSMRWRPALASPSLSDWIGRSSAHVVRLSVRPDKRIPASTRPARIALEGPVFSRCRLVDNLDDLARARLHDHPAIIDDRVAIFGVARHRTQHDRLRQGFADDNALTNGYRGLAARNGREHRVRNFQAESNSRADRSANSLADRAGYRAARSRALVCTLHRGGLGKRRA